MRDNTDFRRGLGAVDFTFLVIGAVIGADVYVVAAIGSSYLGPAQLVAWLVGGVLAAVIALAFVQCAAIAPGVGGSYAYARAAWGPFFGFLTGWALYVGEWISLPIFPLAFVNYLSYFFPNLTFVASAFIKVALVAVVTAVNIRGVRAGGQINDVLTVAKLFPLGVLILAGLGFVIFRPEVAAQHVTPFVPLGWGGFGGAVLLIFWAYAGFELAVLPAGEVKEPRTTLPRGLILGMAIATAFYLLTSFVVVVALPWQVAAVSPRPLADALGAVLAEVGLPSGVGLVLMSLGALVSIAGVYDVFMLSLARLSYAMAYDGFFPPPFARLHPQLGTPYVGLLFQAMTALVISLFFNLTELIAGAVFFLGICYILTALAALRLVQRAPEHRLHVPALRVLLGLAAFSGAYLSLQAPGWLIVNGIAVIAFGAVVFEIRQNAWYRATLIAHEFALSERQFERWAENRERWLLHSVSHLPRRRQESSPEGSLNHAPGDRPKNRKLEVRNKR